MEERREPGAGGLTLRPMTDADAPAVLSIYAAGIATGSATFETEVPSWEGWDRSHLDACRLVAETDGAVVGWAALSPVSGRCVYGGVAEASVYVAEEARGRRIGTRLLRGLAEASESAGFWTLQAGVFPENEASLAILRRTGFRVVGRRERLGRLGDRWHDVMLLERRSEVAGI